MSTAEPRIHLPAADAHAVAHLVRAPDLALVAGRSSRAQCARPVLRPGTVLLSTPSPDRTMSLRLLGLVAASTLVLGACQAPATRPYAVTTSEVPAALQALRAQGVAFAGFAVPAGFKANCRGLGALKAEGAADHGAYLRQAFEAEFRQAGALATTGAPRVTLTGTIDQLDFDSNRALMTGGAWMLALTLTSSNGQRFQMHELYDFDSSLLPAEGCRRTAQAYERAVQNLMRKTVASEEFKALLR
jgi:hypothetical protein